MRRGTTDAADVKNRQAAKHVCCICNMAFATYNAMEITFILSNNESSSFCYEHLVNITNKWRKFFPRLPQSMPKKFDLADYLYQAEKIIEKKSISINEEAVAAIGELLNKTNFSQLKVLCADEKTLKIFI